MQRIKLIENLDKTLYLIESGKGTKDEVISLIKATKAYIVSDKEKHSECVRKSRKTNPTSRALWNLGKRIVYYKKKGNLEMVNKLNKERELIKNKGVEDNGKTK